MRRLIKNRKWWLIVFVLIAFMAIINITSKDSQLFSRFEKPVFTALSPVQNALSRISLSIKGYVDRIPQFFDNQKDKETLEKEVAELLQYKHKFIEYQQENINLRRMLELKQRSFQYDLEAATVIGRDTGNWFNVILIDKGEKHGLKKDMAVINDKGLVGYIASTTKGSAKVVMITDDRSSVSAMIQRTREHGILKGTIAPVPRGYLKMVFLPQDANLIKGDIIISSGLGGVMPKGIVIGEIVEARKEPHELMQYAVVKPIVDFQKLEQVFVIKDQKGD